MSDDRRRATAAVQQRENQIVGRLLGDARERAGLSQAAAARALGVQQSRIAKMEIGKRRITVAEAIRLARLYRIDVFDLDPDAAPPAEPAPARRSRVDHRDSRPRP